MVLLHLLHHQLLVRVLSLSVNASLRIIIYVCGVQKSYQLNCTSTRTIETADEIVTIKHYDVYAFVHFLIWSNHLDLRVSCRRQSLIWGNIIFHNVLLHTTCWYQYKNRMGLSKVIHIDWFNLSFKYGLEISHAMKKLGLADMSVIP